VGAMANPRWQRTWAAASGVIALAFTAADWLARDAGGVSFIAPSHALLWLSLALGGGLGLLGLAQAWLIPRPQRERARWRNLLYSGWYMLLMYGLFAWCWFSEVLVLPAIFAANAVLFAALPPGAVAGALGQPKNAEPIAAADPARFSAPGTTAHTGGPGS
jgi:hypothetical protein